MDIEPFLIAYAINLIVAQRLIRMLCPVCKVADHDPDSVMLDKLGFTEEEINSLTFYEPGNDAHCSNCKGIGSPPVACYARPDIQDARRLGQGFKGCQVSALGLHHGDEGIHCPA